MLCGKCGGLTCRECENAIKEMEAVGVLVQEEEIECGVSGDGSNLFL